MEFELKRTRAFTALVAFFAVLGFGVMDCGNAFGLTQPATHDSSAMAQTVASKKTYADLPTPYPSLYHYAPEACWNNVYDESKVISWQDAGDYVGKTVTVEGDVNSVVYAGSSNGRPYFYNFGSGDVYAPDGFAIVIWSQDISKFDQNALVNEVAWSQSDQPLALHMRVSGVVELYNGRPQITARHGSQVAHQMQDGTWFNYLSMSETDFLLDALYH